MSVDVFTPESFRMRYLLSRRLRETALLASASFLVVFFVWRVWQAKQPILDEAARQIKSGQILVLAPHVGADRLQQSLSLFEEPEQRSFVARKISGYVIEAGPIPNVGALGLITITEADINTEALRSLYGGRLEQSQTRTIRLLTADDLSDRVKPFLAVRSPDEVRGYFWRWISLFLFVFWSTHLLWTLAGCPADPYLLPILLALSGTGFTEISTALIVDLTGPSSIFISSTAPFNFLAISGVTIPRVAVIFAIRGVCHNAILALLPCNGIVR